MLWIKKTKIKDRKTIGNFNKLRRILNQEIKNASKK